VGDRLAKDALFDGFAEVAKALGNGRRAEIIDVLAQGPRHVEDVAAELDQTIANTSFHLRVYQLASDRVIDLWSALREVAVAHHDAVESLADAYLCNRDQLNQIDRSELARRLNDGDLIVVDVRPTPEYASGHIAGAISIPIDQLARTLRNLPNNIEVVAYCRGPYCVMADDAVRLLTKRGRRARRLEGGYPEWRSEQRPVAAEVTR
jgi:rhodanese-related sulfurtransferase